MRPALPSPSLVVACLALAIALGGSAVADQRSDERRATAAKARPAGKVIKARSLTERQVKASSLTGRSVRNDSLTGADVDEGSLGAVPLAAAAASASRARRADSAEAADRAQHAGSADVAASATRADRADRADVAALAEALAPAAQPALVRVARGGQVVLGARGAIQLIARCLMPNGPSDAATLAVVSLDATADGQVYTSVRRGANHDFDANEPLVALTDTEVSENQDSPRLDGWEQGNGFTLYDPATGASTTGDVLAGARIFGARDCVFGVRFGG